MISKILSTISIVGVLGLASYEYLQNIEQQEQLKAFVNKGPRFTAKDGQVLCERVKSLEAASYSYRDAGKTPLACDYETQK